MADLNALVTISAEDNASHTLDSVAGQFDKLGTSSKAAGVAVAAGVVAIGAAIAGLAKAAYDLGSTFDEQYDKIRVATGATGQSLDALRDNFRNVAANVPDDFGKVGTAISDLSVRLKLTDEPLESLSKTFLQLSRITGTDLAENIRLASRVFADAGVKAEDYEKTLNKLFAAHQLTGVAIQTLQERLVQYGAPLRQLGFGIDQSIALLSKFEQEGVNTELVMGSLRIALGNLAEAGVPLKEGFQSLIQVIKDAKTDSEGTALAIQAFGARAGPDMAAAIREGRFEIQGLVSDLQESKETIAEATSATEDAKERMGTAWNKVKLAAEPAGTAIFNLAGNISTVLAGAIEDIGPDLVTFIKSLSPTGSDAADEMNKSSANLAKTLRDIGNVLGTVGRGLEAFDNFLKERWIPTVKTAIALKNALESGTGPQGPLIGPPNINEGAQPNLPKGVADRLNELFGGNREGFPTVVPPGEEPSTPEPPAAATESAVERRNRALEDQIRALLASGGKSGGGGGGGSAAAGKEAAESAIDGFISGLQGGEANMQATMNSLGAKLGTALNEAVASNSKSGGAQVARTLEDVVNGLRAAGVEDWRELGDNLAAALHDALVARTPEALAVALDAIKAMSRQIDESQFWQAWAKAGEDAAIRVNTAIQNTADKIAATFQSAKDRIQGIWDNLELTRKIDEARAHVEEVLGIIRNAQEEGTRKIQNDRQAEDIATQRLRQDADRRSALAQQIADIRRRGGPTTATDVRAAQQAFDRETASIQVQRDRENADRTRNAGRSAQDIARAAGNAANISEARGEIEQALGIDASQLRRAEAARQTAAIWDGARKSEKDFNTELAATIKTQQDGLDATFQTLQEKFPTIKTAADSMLTVMREDSDAIRLNFEEIAPYLTGASLPRNGGNGDPAAHQTNITNYGIVADMPTFTRLTLDAQRRTEQQAVATQGA